MKTSQLVPAVVLAGSLFLSACVGANTTASLPAAAVTSALSGEAHAIAVSAPLTSSAKTTAATTAADSSALENTYEAIYQQVNPSVVTIEISSEVSSMSFGLGRQRVAPNAQTQIVPTAEGSGFIWDNAGYIVTNNHVVDGAAKISVTFSNGATYDAKLVGTDPNSDLAVIQVVDAPQALFQPVSVGDSTQVKVGQMVVAIGNPYGLANTMTTGIVSAIARTIQASAENSASGTSSTAGFSIPDVIQTDAAINPGNSGGVLVDLNGDLIGVPSQIESSSGANSGIGFAIPSAIVSKVVPQLISNGKAAHSYLGFSGATLTSELIGQLNLEKGLQGIVVASVVAGGPAEKAGLKAVTLDANGNPTAVGDIITGIDGKSVTRFEDLVSYLSGYTEPGQTVSLTLLRDGKEIQLQVTLGTQPTN